MAYLSVSGVGKFANELRGRSRDLGRGIWGFCQLWAERPCDLDQAIAILAQVGPELGVISGCNFVAQLPQGLLEEPVERLSLFYRQFQMHRCPLSPPHGR